MEEVNIPRPSGSSRSEQNEEIDSLASQIQEEGSFQLLDEHEEKEVCAVYYR